MVEGMLQTALTDGGGDVAGARARCLELGRDRAAGPGRGPRFLHHDSSQATVGDGEGDGRVQEQRADRGTGRLRRTACSAGNVFRLEQATTN